MKKLKKLKYYPDCRLNIEWDCRSKNTMPSALMASAGGFESDPETVNTVLDLLYEVYGRLHHAKVTDFDGGLNFHGCLNRSQVRYLAKEAKKFWTARNKAFRSAGPIATAVME